MIMTSIGIHTFSMGSRLQASPYEGVETFLKQELESNYMKYSRIPTPFGGISCEDRLLKNIDALIGTNNTEKISVLKVWVEDSKMSDQLKSKIIQKINSVAAPIVRPSLIIPPIGHQDILMITGPRIVLEAALSEWVANHDGSDQTTKVEVRDIILAAFDNKSKGLNLKGRALKSLPPLVGLTQLKSLDLSGNQIKLIPENAFHGLAKLESLHLMENEIDLNMISRELFEGPDKLAFFGLDKNLGTLPKWAIVTLELPQAVDLGKPTVIRKRE
jgi:hypothetical protein